MIGVLWSIFWMSLVTNSPDNHPSISLDERNYIVNSQQTHAFNTRVGNQLIYNFWVRSKSETIANALPKHSTYFNHHNTPGF